MSGKLVLIDGHSILNRAFYGVPDLTNAEGLHTNAIYGFLNILFKILDEEQADYLAVAFDVHAPTFRHEMYEAYKGTRKAMPDELRQQVPVMKQVLQAMNVQILERAGLEADDILGTIAGKAERNGMDVALVSGDRDLLQIATDKIKIRMPKTKFGKTEITDYYAKDVLEEYQVTPAQFIQLKALMGDTSDNIPGVPKVGEKTATSLMVTFGSLDNIYANLDKIDKKSIRTSLEENRDMADLSLALATIKTDCDIDLDYERAKAEGFYTPEAYQLFKKLELKNIIKRFDEQGDCGSAVSVGMAEVQLLGSLEDLEEKLEKVSADSVTGLQLAMQESELYGVALAFSENEIYYLNSAGFGGDREERLYGLLKDFSATHKIATCDIKKQYAYLCRESTEQYFDIVIAAYLLNPLKSDYDGENIAAEHLDMILPGYSEVFGKQGFAQLMLTSPEKISTFFGSRAAVARKAESILREKLASVNMLKLMTEVEMPLSLVLYEMEQEGIAVRPEALKAYGEALQERIVTLEQDIHTKAGMEFNINSPKQLGEVLFEKMGIQGGKKTKTGYSTAADVLEKLAPDYPIVNDILEYRTLTKLKSTYADGLAAYIGEDNRIHTSFNQTITATGRISSTEPNLQNIPMRMELGRSIRKVFVPRDGCIFMDADYSQIELRVLAHMSGDVQLIEAYRQEQDIHRITASQVFHTPFEEVTDLQRRNAKAVNFGIVYGISSFGLSQDLSISRKEAQAYIEKYFETYPGVKAFLDKLVEDAKVSGYIETMFGRRRPVPELASSNFMQRSFGERIAMNSPIQGTAADIIKIAMIKVWKALKDSGLRSRLILQVHDELLIETYTEETEQVKKILEENMKSAAQLAVNLETDLHTGATWYDAK